MDYPVARRAESHQILCSVIAQSASRLNVMDLKVLPATAGLAPPTISLQDFAAELAIALKVKPKPWLFRSNSLQSITCTSSSSCLI
jgi:hypothetical protein